MNRARLMETLKTTLNDSQINGLWDTSLLWIYLSSGQDKFCEDTGYFKDKTNYTITLQTGVSSYSIPSRIIQIVDIWDGNRKLSKIPTGSVHVEGATGDPNYWSTDIDTGAIKFYPSPTADENGDSFILQVWRYSQNELALGWEPEIPTRFSMALIHWAAHQAFGHDDAEQNDPKKAESHLRNYYRYVKDGKISLQRYQNQEISIGCDQAYVV